MPKTPTDYSNSVIYKIEHLEKPELVYVGSTTNFTKRKCKHKYNCNNQNSKNYNCKLYKMIRENGGFNEFKIMIICEFPCNNKIELIIEEEKHRKELQASLNSYKAFRNNEENIIYKKEYYKEYNNNNKEINKIKNKIYRENNKEKITEYRNNSNEKITCDCGSIISKSNKLRHEKSKKHCQFIQQT